MVRAEQKSLREILASVEGFQNILIVGCGGCASVDLYGGFLEAQKLKTHLKMNGKNADYLILERQCDAQYFSQINVSNYDCVLSMACGAGVQNIAEYFPNTPTFPTVNVHGIGTTLAPGVSEKKCNGCGDCVLAFTGGICPKVRCAKRVFHGPCGGVIKGGLCETSKVAGEEIDCAWCKIIERLEKQDRMSDLKKLTVQKWNGIPKTIK